MKDPNEDRLMEYEAEQDYYSRLEGRLELQKHLLVESIRDDPSRLSEELTESLSTYISDRHGEMFIRLLSDDVEGVVEELDGWVDWYFETTEES